jgi:hypothetical protein
MEGSQLSAISYQPSAISYQPSMDVESRRIKKLLKADG